MNKSLDLLVQEHRFILALTDVVRQACMALMQGEEPDTVDFRSMIGFIRHYADAHHHGKEEQILFDDMERELGQTAVNLIRHGMLVEHNLARFHVLELEEALDAYDESPNEQKKLDILVSAMTYSQLLRRHIDKEDNVLYPYADKNLSEQVLSSIDQRSQAYEDSAARQGTQEKWLQTLRRLQEKYPS